MVVYFATVVRSAPIEESGELVQLDWDRKAVLARQPLVPVNPPVAHDPNPRGGTRGGRGVLVDGDQVMAASYHSVHVFTRDLKPIRQISHPLFSNLHELAWDESAIWVTATGVDAAFKIDRGGNVLDSWWPSEDPLIAARFGLHPVDVDRSADVRLKLLDRGANGDAPDQVHLNAAAVHGGRPLMLLNRLGCLVRLKPTEIVVEDLGMRGCHNILVTRCGHILLNDSHHMAVNVYAPSGRRIQRLDLSQLPPVQRILRRQMGARLLYWLRRRGRPYRLFRSLLRQPRPAKPIWVRGLCETPRGTILVGISPASVLEVEWTTGELVDHYSYSASLRVCIHGLTCEPTVAVTAQPAAPRLGDHCVDTPFEATH